ncbi:MAG: hypothetical protein LWW96_20475 [Acidovorax sp.]|uniref:hypothetical protein n=1 Tax=Acidovorax sp. TaxID=1872122 RepID=UPI0025BA0501|nr:hypothetical protein [Acidovorax sp.]MCE1194528.1 hypothetical protein [Acidovorax sp.]
MTDTALDRFVSDIRTAWGPLTSVMASQCAEALARLANTPATEPWLAAVLSRAADTAELHRDAEQGFLLLAHTEPEGMYRPPHDHGHSWGIYGVVSGEIDMATFARVEDADGKVRLVQRDEERLGPGDIKLFLPGDIHDTRCVKGPALELRFTERDLKNEDLVHRRMTRYVSKDGNWTV